MQKKKKGAFRFTKLTQRKTKNETFLYPPSDYKR